MAELWPVPALSIGARASAELLDRYGLRPDKRLGQHFLVDPNQVDRIVRLADVEPGDNVIEVGPGLGALTTGLLAAGARVVAVEVDPDLARVIEAEYSCDELRVVTADALEVDWAEIAPAESPGQRWKMVANLPYNVATPLVLNVLDDAPHIDSLLVMVQREVGERFVAPPGGRDYGVPSVKVAYHAKGSVVAKVPASVFLPPPRVESALVRLDRHSSPPFNEPIDQVFTLVRAAFAQRRKMLRSSLKGLVTEAAFDAAEVDATLRPEMLDIATWCRLAGAVRDLG